MPWVEFSDSFNFTPAADRRSTTAYKAGHKALVTTECFEAAKAARKADRIATPKRAETPSPVAILADVPANPVRGG